MNQTRPTDARDTAVDESKRQVSISQTERGQASPEEGGWSSLWDAFARGVRDNMVGEAVVQILRIGGLVFLARALRPQDFGLFKVLAVIGMFGILFAEAGIPEALIQRADLRREHEVTAWWSTLAIAFALVTALYLGAPWLASFMGMKELIVGTRLLCIPLLLQGVAVCAHARLRRELRFGVIAAANVLAEIMFYNGRSGAAI
jgi:polysaccharide transporter, PST family